MNGLWIVVTVTALFLASPAQYQQFFYTHIWTHFAVANALGVAVSVYFYVAGGDEMYARCVTRDQVGADGRLKQPLALSSPVPEATRFFLGE